MERPIHTPINAPVQDLDTPALVIDRDNITANRDLFSQKITVLLGFVWTVLDYVTTRENSFLGRY